jgi:hypothetical protein
MLVVLTVGSVLIGVAYYYLGDSLEHIATVVLILAGNVYGMCVLVVLLAYGIAFVPITVWKKTNYDARLYEELLAAQEVWFEFRDARLEYIKQVSLCSNLADKYRDIENTHWMDKLLAELPQNDLDGQKIYVAKYF